MRSYLIFQLPRPALLPVSGCQEPSLLDREVDYDDYSFEVVVKAVEMNSRLSKEGAKEGGLAADSPQDGPLMLCACSSQQNAEVKDDSLECAVLAVGDA